MPENQKPTLVIGASLREGKYSNICVQTLLEAGFPVIAIGGREGFIDQTKVHNNAVEVSEIHTVTLYLNAMRQRDWYDYILRLKPERVIFNPGAENPEFQQLLASAGIETLEACTIVMVKALLF